MNTFPRLMLAAVLIAVPWVVYRWQQRKYLTQYAFFLRFPLMLGLAAMTLPIVAPIAAASMLDNLFITTPVGIFWVTIFATVSAWAIVYSGAVIWYSVPVRNKLPFDRQTTKIGKLPDSLTGWRQFVLAEIVVLPLLIVLVVRVEGERSVAALYALLANLIGHALAVYAGERAVDRFLGLDTIQRWLASGWIAKLVSLVTAHHAGRTPAPALVRTEDFAEEDLEALHLRAFAFTVVSVIVYALLGIFYTIFPQVGVYVPALGYLVAAQLVLAWVLGWLSLKFDVYRVPVVTVILIVLSAWFWIVPHGHTYEVTARPATAGHATPDSDKVLDQFAQTRSDGTLIVVAASGGGITAEYWSAVVLDGVGRELARAPGRFDFHRHVAIVSSVSGGSVGCMYYLDAFRPNDVERNAHLGGIVQSAGTSSLSAVTWGIAYPDVVRLALGDTLGRYDRGWALERDWARRLGDPDATLGTWREGVVAGWRPLSIFNVTLEETGERLAISPVKLLGAEEKQSQFLRAISARDMSVATAARLSASFPYVAPRALPDPATGAVDETKAPADFHGADGGYFDNSGIYSALVVLHRWLSDHATAPVKRVILVEISAFPTHSDFATNQSGGDSVISSLTGPLSTLFNVRSATQISRKDFELAALEDLWSRRFGVELDHVTFYLADGSPLSWLLTPGERATIAAQSPATQIAPLDDGGDEAKRIQQAWRDNREQLGELIRYAGSERRH